MSLESWARLHVRWYADPMIRACAKEHSETIAVWPVLIALAKDCSGPENLDGMIQILADDLAHICVVETSKIYSVLQVLQEAELIEFEKNRLDCLKIKIIQFSKYQTAKRTKAERDSRYRNSFAGKTSKNATVARRSRDVSATIDRDRDRDINRDIKSLVKIPEIPQEQKTESETTVSSSTAAPIDHAVDLFNFWIKTTNRSPNQNKLTRSRRGMVNGRIKDGFSIDQLKQAIEGIASSPWHTGSNPSGKRYDTFDFIFRSAENIEKGIEHNTSNTKTAIGQSQKDLDDTRQLYVEMGLTDNEIDNLLAKLQTGSQ